MDRFKEQSVPTMAFQLDFWKPAVASLKPLMKYFQQNTTLSFFPDPKVVVQHVSKTGFTLRVTFDKKCFFIVDKNNFLVKTISNNIQLLGNFLELPKKHQLTKLHVSDTNDMYVRIHVNAGDTRHQIQVACINEQEIIKDLQKATCSVVLPHKILVDVLKWSKQIIREKTIGQGNRDRYSNPLVTITVSHSPSFVRFDWKNGEVVYSVTEDHIKMDIPSGVMKINLRAKQIYDTTLCTSVGKSSCVFNVYKTDEASLVVWTVSTQLCRVDVMLPSEETSDVVRDQAYQSPDDRNDTPHDVSDTDSPNDTDGECPVPTKKKC